MSEGMKAVLDRYVERFVSRKFLTWLTATWLVLNTSLTSEDWVAVSLVYISSQAAVDLAKAWRHG